MKLPKLTRLELKIMETFWKRGACSVREIQEAFPERKRPAYTTVQTTVYRLEDKKALRLVKRIGKAKVFEAAISRDQAQTRLIDELLSLFGGQVKPVMARLVESGKLTTDDVKDIEEMLREHRGREPANASPIGRSHQGREPANASPIGRSHQGREPANASPIGRSHQGKEKEK